MHILNSKKLAFLVLILISFSCAKEPLLRRQIDESVAKRIDKKITCNANPENTCAIKSEFHELAERAFRNSTPENPQHFISLLNIGQDALLARIHLIRSARKSIELQTYIWENDEVGRLVFMELLKAARRGVKVRIIVDQMGSSKDPGLVALLATLHINLEIAFYNPTFARSKVTPLTLTTGVLFSFKKINQRMHNKLLIIDERIGIAGGRNIENKYYDYDSEYSFKDRDIIVVGPAVRSSDRPVSNLGAKNWSARSAISVGSSIRPGPISPHAWLPEAGPQMIIPRLVKLLRFSWVTWLRYIC